MKTTLLRFALVLSLLVNAGVIGAVAWRSLAVGEPAAAAAVNLPQYLGLDERQRRHWHEAEDAFLARLAAGAEEVRGHRDRMIVEIFSAQPDHARIDAERAAIARLQDEQQKLVVGQLLRERELLTPLQRERLAGLLAAQPVGPSAFERLHRE
ncbi:Spy/CpxP family protein refolding chaperone [Azospira restricta]|uniref:Periplasmic heavy metal sensor n=1 Tax=Azospira restricta TaxID=404405 RepID=A0A974Y328_9RHOO|nr:periplasmic heavy metal sensor [Azospira restricta]QRJ63650.1 periplasmic heavy metal sensor [Azospira restricta]